MVDIKSTPYSSISPVGQANSMSELLAKYKPRVLARGEEVEALVLSVKGGRVSFDLGTKAEGVVEGREFEYARDFIRTLRPGKKVKVIVVNPEAESGVVLVSLRRAGENAAWLIFEDAAKTQEPIEVTGKKITRGGITVEVFGITGFVPTSQLSSATNLDLASLLQKSFFATVLEADRDKGRVIFSERSVTEKDIIEKENSVISGLQVGEVLIGIVVHIIPSGVFIQLEKDGVIFEGFVHVREITYSSIEDPQEVLTVGDKVTVIFIGTKRGKPSFSIKQAQAGAWEKIKNQYLPDTRVKGVVAKIIVNNIMVTFADGLFGYLSTTKLPAGKSVKEGETIDCLVESVDERKQRINLVIALTTKPVGYK